YHARQQQLGAEWFNRGQAETAAGYPEKAVDDLSTALLYNPDEPTYRLQLAVALLEAKKYDQAAAHFQTLLQDEPGDGFVNLELARLAAIQGNTDAALRFYHGAIFGVWQDKADE